MNCALGPESMRPHLETLQARGTSVASVAIPTRDCPTRWGSYDLDPAQMAALVGEFADAGWLNIVGGCCGTTPDHIAAIAERIARCASRTCRPTVAPLLRLSGTQPLALRPESNFLMIGERTNVTGSRNSPG